MCDEVNDLGSLGSKAFYQIRHELRTLLSNTRDIDVCVGLLKDYLLEVVLEDECVAENKKTKVKPKVWFLQ